MDSTNDHKKYTTFALRFWAGFIDGLMFLPLGFVALFVDWYNAVWLTVVWIAISNSIIWIYTVVGHAVYGQTVGKQHQRIIVLDNLTEEPIGWRQAILRDSFVIVTNTLYTALVIYVICYGISEPSAAIRWTALILNYGTLIWFVTEIVTCLTNPKRRALHDFIAGTVVVRVEK